MLSFFGEPALKSAVRRRVAEHQRLDQIVQGTYWESGRGCFIGCSLHSSEHDAFPRLLGLPEWYAHLGEAIFEGLSGGEHSTFALEVYDATPVGANLDRVRDLFLIETLADVRSLARPDGQAAIDQVTELLRARAEGRSTRDRDWAAAGAAAGAAARVADWAAGAADWAARAAVAAWAAVAAGAAAWAAAGAAGAAAWSAAWSADATDWRRMRERFVRLLRECEPEPVVAATLPDTPEFTSYYAAVQREAGLAW